MLPKQRKHYQSLPPDILSNLPYNVIDVILMHLPCKDAVRTSVLSKKWRYHWCRLTKLKLDGSHWKSPKDLLYPTIKFTKIIYQLLTLHEGPITKFELDFADLKSCPEIDNFVSFLSRSIQHLSLHFPRDEEDEPYKLPSSLFRCSQLEHLTLHNCLIHHPSALSGFDRLLSMELIEVTISSELLEGLISRCPLLEQLVLDSEIRSVIEIDAPMLKSFDFTGNMSSIRLKNVPLLAKVSLKNRYEESKNSDIAKFFKSCSALEHLSLKCGYYELEEVVEAPTRLSLNLNHVKHFYLHNIFLMGSHQLSCVVWLLRSFPCLEYLEIQAIPISSEGYDAAQNTIELEHLVDVTFDHLREVKLVEFTGIPAEMQLIKLLLANSPVLKMLTGRLRFLYHQESKEKSKIRSKVEAEVASFLRASPEAEVEVAFPECYVS